MSDAGELEVSIDAYNVFSQVWVSDRPLSFNRARGESSRRRELIEVPAASLERCELLLHSEEDLPGGPVLEITQSQDESRTAIDYAGWRFAITRDDPIVRYAAMIAAPEVPFDEVIERSIAPFIMLDGEGTHIALHGGAFARGGRAWICIGPSGVGKSTTALELTRRGAALISDDMALVDALRMEAVPGATTLRLWKYIVEEAVTSRSIIGTEQNKKWFRLPESYAAYRPTPLAGVILLSPNEAAPTSGQVTRLAGMRAMVKVLEQCFDLHAPRVAWSTRRLSSVRELVSRVPVWVCEYARTTDRTPAHVEAIWDLIEGDE